jgi:hypothetical protein
MEGLRKWHEVISNIGHLITIINPWDIIFVRTFYGQLTKMEGGRLNYKAPYCNNPPGEILFMYERFMDGLR